MSSREELSRIIGFSDWDLEAVAIIEKKQEYLYADLLSAICALNLLLPQTNDGPVKIGILTTRSSLAYACVLLSVYTGNTFVPLNPAFPAKHLASIIDIAAVDIVISYDKHADLFAQIDTEASLISIFLNSFEDLLHSEHSPLLATLKIHSDNNIAYEMFTSGTTGTPKGVPVTYRSLASYISNLKSLFPVCPDDRCSQVFDISFDLSMHDIFITFSSGACLVPASDMDLLMPVQYIGKNKISVWFSVPSMANVVRSAKKIDNNHMASLRLSQFCGEPLTQGLANKWLEIAPQSELVNLYGPTECTIAISYKTWSSCDFGISSNETVPIGQVFPDHHWGLFNDYFIDAKAHPSDEPISGELLIAGPQVFSGYSNNESPDTFYKSVSGQTYYRTGDCVTFYNNEITHNGRLDDQVKIKGYRIELGDVEAKLKNFYQSEDVVVVTDREVGPQYLVAMLGESLRVDDFTPPDSSAANIPVYMMPSQYIFVPPFFRNASGKIDRRKMAQTYLTDFDQQISPY